MKKITFLIAFLFSFLLSMHAQQYNKVKVITMPDGTRKAVIVKEGENDVSEGNSSSENQKRPSVTQPVVPPQENKNTDRDWYPPQESELFLTPGSPVGKREPILQDNFYQPYYSGGWQGEESYHKKTFGVTLGYEVIPYGGFSNYKHTANIQLIIQNFLLDGLIGGFGTIETDFEEEGIRRIEDKCIWGINLGYKINLNERFDIYPVAGVLYNYEISDDLMLDYGIGMHYRLNNQLFLNYKMTRYTAGIGLGIYFF